VAKHPAKGRNPSIALPPFSCLAAHPWSYRPSLALPPFPYLSPLPRVARQQVGSQGQKGKGRQGKGRQGKRRQGKGWQGKSRQGKEFCKFTNKVQNRQYTHKHDANCGKSFVLLQTGL
jgi:hypothetical protein